MNDIFAFEFKKDEFINGVNLFGKKVNEIKDNFNSITKLLNELEDESTWDSDTSREITGNSKEIKTSFKNAEDEFKSFTDYLLTVLEDYENEDNKTNEVIDNNVKNLDR